MATVGKNWRVESVDPVIPAPSSRASSPAATDPVALVPKSPPVDPTVPVGLPSRLPPGLEEEIQAYVDKYTEKADEEERRYTIGLPPAVEAGPDPFINLLTRLPK
ncbi:hypothetical protein ACRALDRAFT_1066432 [Sodiomyces alcalophilus JCM 7366]|uniref:uncharacterized protein n=1 Tax=Sodiomyces alcalophilus JCM 7366 TaxID=591952 RepID=UPI0039B4B8E6